MISDMAASLRLLKQELSKLDTALLREQTESLSDLRSLENSAELSALSALLCGKPTPNVFEIMEEFGNVNRHDERLHTRFMEFFLNPRDERQGLYDMFTRALLRRTKFFQDNRPIEIDLAGCPASVGNGESVRPLSMRHPVGGGCTSQELAESLSKSTMAVQH
jgi:hypothetical protein